MNATFKQSYITCMYIKTNNIEKQILYSKNEINQENPLIEKSGFDSSGFNSGADRFHAYRLLIIGGLKTDVVWFVDPSPNLIKLKDY